MCYLEKLCCYQAVQKFFPKKLILAFEVIKQVTTRMQTYYCTIFPFLEHFVRQQNRAPTYKLTKWKCCRKVSYTPRRKLEAVVQFPPSFMSHNEKAKVDHSMSMGEILKKKINLIQKNYTLKASTRLILIVYYKWSFQVQIRTRRSNDQRTANGNCYAG